MLENIGALVELVSLDALKGAVTLVVTPVLAGLGGYFASKIFGKKDKEKIARLERLLGLSLDELEYYHAIESEHVRNNELYFDSGLKGTMRKNARIFCGRMSTQRFSPSQIHVLRNELEK